MARVIRDPIHGDIPVGPLETAIINTRIFQRLRYIRQNGLLHFIFPGAVHTRFSHSIGTYAIACRLFDHLSQPLWCRSDADGHHAIEYLRRVFSSAALLHDIGHCAFSHSLDKALSTKGTPLIGTPASFGAWWGEDDFVVSLNEFRAGKGISADAPIEHEEISGLLVGSILKDGAVADCLRSMRIDVQQFTDCIRGVLIPGLAPIAASFDESARQLVPALSRLEKDAVCSHPVEPDRLPESLLGILAGLLSGTFDVDRLDYLARDSHYCGVSYGHLDPDYLIRSLCIGGYPTGDLVLFLDSRGAHSVEDLVWSRYQMFVQVYGHKLNALLNKILKTAVSDSVDQGVVVPPDSRETFIGFTDDYVMSSVIRACLRNPKLERELYVKVLVDRDFPAHIISEHMPSNIKEKKEDGSETEEFTEWRETGMEHAAEIAGITRSEILLAESKGSIGKSGNMPPLLSGNRFGKPKIRDFTEASSLLFNNPSLSTSSVLLHFFVDSQSKDGVSHV